MTIIAGKYEVLKELGEGASGKVYLVKHTDLDVRYALKILDRSLSEHARFIERFKREAEVLLRFSHPGSIQVRDFGKTADGLYYMAMDFCQGISLKKVLEREGAFRPARALDILNQVLAVLVAAHKVGIIHRDIKPENIMLEVDDLGREVVKILDFGIAKLKESLDTNVSMTIEGASIGTPQYMSPEQAAGEKDLDHRVDLYAAGILTYEMLTGAVPFKGQTVLQTLLMHLTQPVEPFAERMGFPDYLEALVLKALEKNREQRYQDAVAFGDACRKAIQMMSQPVVVAEAPTEEIASDAVEESTETEKVVTEAKEPLKILCLDDSEMILHIMKHILEQAGYEVFTANNASSIHSYLFTQNVKLLISDVQMPDLPGTKVCKMLKKSISDLKIVLFSNLPDRELEKLSEESNADGWISKNTKPAEWLEKINEIIHGPVAS